ncbi:hypothetical protein [Neisseria mucosa]|uniref:hypothetical protein n=1 Tax=Neisseria mucosa TaxID=488 RepID=UPI00280AE608|nr:hypothetical protein [Neisseria mucosa]
MSDDKSKTYTHSARIPLPFGALIAERKPSNRLPIPFTRPLRHIAAGGAVAPIEPPKPKPPEPYAPPAGYAAVSGEWGFVLHAAGTGAACLTGGFAGGNAAVGMSGVSVEAVDVAHCFQTTFDGVAALEGRLKAQSEPSFAVSACAAGVQSAMDGLDGCSGANTTASLFLTGCGGDAQAAQAGERLETHSDSTFSDDALLVGCLQSDILAAADLARCFSPKSLPAVTVPCEYYEIPVEPEPVPETYVCGIRPPSNRLALRFYRKKIAHDPRHIPLPFACFDTAKTPVLNGYIMKNTVKATADGQPIELFSASFTADTGGYCWQGSLTVSPEDFAKINPDARAKGEEAQIKVQINADTFVILAEDYSDNRRFGQKSYTVTGRSVTARLGADYAPKGSGTYRNPIYAQQIATEVLRPTGVGLDGWTMADWLIPADVYALTDKTPMAVLQELAQAAADVTVPASVIYSISGQRNVSERANGIYVWPSHNKGKGADVYRNGSNREPRASALTHALYTDQPVLLAAGVAALSATGVHKRETVSLPVSDKYAIPMANLGEIWQISEPSGNWQGVVVGVSVEVKIENDAPVVTQNVSIDRYLDE